MFRPVKLGQLQPIARRPFRPHGSLKGLIPMESYTKPDQALDLRQAIQQARAIRIAENKQVNCSFCPGTRN